MKISLTEERNIVRNCMKEYQEDYRDFMRNYKN
jgi:chloramphenicol O-acetyltransferase